MSSAIFLQQEFVDLCYWPITPRILRAVVKNNNTHLHTLYSKTVSKFGVKLNLVLLFSTAKHMIHLLHNYGELIYTFLKRREWKRSYSGFLHFNYTVWRTVLMSRLTDFIIARQSEWEMLHHLSWGFTQQDQFFSLGMQISKPHSQRSTTLVFPPHHKIYLFDSTPTTMKC